MLTCKLICSSSAEHLSQLYTGFGLLEKAGLIRLELTRGKDFEIGVMAKPVIKAVINNNIKVVYDTYDGDSFFYDELTWSDFYFKRSFNLCTIESGNLSNKIFPLGFNYSVYGPYDYSSQRILWLINSINRNTKPKDLAVQIIRNNYYLSRIFNTSNGKFNCDFRGFEQLPNAESEPKIIFCTRLWDPNRTKSDARIAERVQMNNTRIEIIRKLRNEFRNLFVGGLEPTEFALRNYPEYVIIDRKTTKKNRYLQLLKQSAIGIATVGLLGSNGWKLAEYIAGSKAIVTEKINFSVPGNFQEKTNYLKFTTPDECVENVTLLVENKEKRYEIMKHNFLYYQEFLRPDNLIWNTLSKIMEIV